MHRTTCRCGDCRAGSADAFEVLEFGVLPLFSETEENELAMELLSVSNEAELDQFLGKVFSSAWRGIKKVGAAVGKVAAPLAGALRGVAKAALPLVGGALGSFIPIPGVGTMVGSALGGMLSKALELEFEGVEREQQAFERAVRFVRIAASAAQHVAQDAALGALAAPGQDPGPVVRAALERALRSHVPGLAQVPRPLTGRWRQRRATFVLGQP
jgi:hypothetical protein